MTIVFFTVCTYIHIPNKIEYCADTMIIRIMEQEVETDPLRAPLQETVLNFYKRTVALTEKSLWDINKTEYKIKLSLILMNHIRNLKDTILERGNQGYTSYNIEIHDIPQYMCLNIWGAQTVGDMIGKMVQEKIGEYFEIEITYWERSLLLDYAYNIVIRWNKSIHEIPIEKKIICKERAWDFHYKR